MRYSHLLIATINFECTNYVDTVDGTPTAQDVLAKLVEILQKAFLMEF